jgi:polysaccharide biosynthesis/export protein
MRMFAMLAIAVLVPAGTFAQAPAPPAVPTAPLSTQPVVPAAPAAAPAAVVPPDYVIGPDDVLGIVFWEQANHGGDVIVRPDGKITLPLINDIQAAGLTPDQLRQAIVTASAKFLRDPNVTVIVKQTNSRRVYVTGRVNKPGTYVITTPVTVLQMLALAGGVADFAKKDRIVVMRTEGQETKSLKFNYKDVTQGKQLEQNILLKPGDTVIVP